jgi:CheY-like chemotaxis protein
MMPETDGYEVCRRLKQDPRARDIPVLLRDVDSDEGMAGKAARIGTFEG